MQDEVIMDDFDNFIRTRINIIKQKALIFGVLLYLLFLLFIVKLKIYFKATQKN